MQPHSGAQANQAVFLALLQPGDRIMGLNLAHGGHLTHGHKMNFSGRYYNIVPYGVDPKSELINYDELEQLAVQNKPKLICAGASAYSRVIDFPRLRAIADQVGALLMVDMAHIAGLVATGLHPSPVGPAQFATTTAPKNPPGPPGRLLLCTPEMAKERDKGVSPGLPCGPPDYGTGPNGATLAAILSVAVFLWFHDLRLALTVGLALIANVSIAAVVGTLVPLTHDRLGRDPAVSSSVFVNFVTDFMGFLFLLGHVSYTHLRAHETVIAIVCRLLLEKKQQKQKKKHT